MFLLIYIQENDITNKNNNNGRDHKTIKILIYTKFEQYNNKRLLLFTQIFFPIRWKWIVFMGFFIYAYCFTMFA